VRPLWIVFFFWNRGVVLWWGEEDEECTDVVVDGDGGCEWIAEKDLVEG
jgi:hypothetical protein